MLKQANRFHGHGSLRFVYRNGQAVRSSLMTLKFITNPHRQNDRFAVVVSKKVIKSAVRRNRIRRRVYEIIRHELPYLKKSHDVVLIIVSAEALSMPHSDLLSVVKQLLSQAKLYK